LSVIKFKENYASVGAGNPVATGCLAVLSEQKATSNNAVRVALKTTAKHSNMAMPPFTFITI